MTRLLKLFIFPLCLWWLLFSTKERLNTFDSTYNKKSPTQKDTIYSEVKTQNDINDSI